ncbi:MAG: helix-turn-helix domain-containing protein [Rikenellaceae bacterium]
MNNILAEHLNDANVKFEVSLTTLIELLDYVEANRREQPKSIEPLLTQEEVINILKVDGTTLWRWRSRQYLNAIKIGGKIRYRQEDIAALINEEGGADL